MHEAEGAPLVWSEAKKTWITTQEAELDGEETLQASSSSRDSPSGSQNPLPSSGAPGKKPVRAISALSDGEPIYVAFEDDDPDNPFEWPRKKKWIITGIGAWLTTLGMCLSTFSFKCEKVESTAHPLHDRRSVAIFCSRYRWTWICGRHGQHARGTWIVAYHGLSCLFTLPVRLRPGPPRPCPNLRSLRSKSHVFRFNNSLYS